MSYPPKFPFSDICMTEGTASIGATPVPGVIVSPCAGILRKVFAAAGGTTTGTITVAVAVNAGADITGGALTIAAGSNARVGTGLEFKTVGSVITLAEGDIITFTPSGGGGASIPGGFTAVIRKL